MHHTLFETRKERMSKGKPVDAGNNMVAGIGGLGFFTSMVGGAYNEQYKEFLEGDEMEKLPMEQKNYIGDGSDQYSGNKISNKGNGNGNSNILELFNTPNKFGVSGKEYSTSFKTNKYGVSKYKK